MNIYLYFLVGLVVGAVATIIIYLKMKDSFKAISYDALSKNRDEFLKSAEKSFENQAKIHQQVLESKKGLIEQTFAAMKERLEELRKSVTELEKDRKQQFGAVTTQLQSVAEQSARIQNALANSRIRGQWGERMAEDILRLAGFIEGIN